MRARWYDPSVGRFINEDTYEGEINNPLSLNLYTYVVNNPLIYTDPSGHDHRVDGGSGGGGNIRIPKWITWGANGSKKPIIEPSTNPQSPRVKITTNTTIRYDFSNSKLQKEILNEKAYFRASTKAKGMGNAFDVAKSGGKHSGFYNQYTGKSKVEIQKGIQSLDKQIVEHQDKIRNSEAHIPNFKDLDPRQQEALINKKWPSDIQRQLEQKEILEGILRSR